MTENIELPQACKECQRDGSLECPLHWECFAERNKTLGKGAPSKKEERIDSLPA